MDALEQAKQAMEYAEDDSITTDEAHHWFFAKAQAYAAIAQAEQLKRIADALYMKDLQIADIAHAIFEEIADKP